MLILLSAFIYFFGNTQEGSKNDSLRERIRTATSDSLRVEALYEYMKVNLNNNTSDFEPYIKQMAFLSKKINYRWGLSTAYILGLSYYKNQGKLDQALAYADSVAYIAKGDTAEKMRTNMAHMYNNRGNLYSNIGDYEKALQNYFQAEKIFKQVHNKTLASVYNNIAHGFMLLHNRPKALEFAQKAVSTAKVFKDNRLLATNMMNLATEYMNINNYPAADSLLKLVWPIVAELKNDKSFHVYYYNKGDLEAYYKKDTLKALDYFQKSYDYAVQMDDAWQQGNALDHMISFQMDLKRKDAKANIDNLYQLAVENELDDYKASALDYYSQWYSNQGDYKRAFEYSKQFRSLSDSLNSNEIKEKASMMEVRFRVAGKEQEIQQLKADQKIQQLTIRQKNTLNYFLIAIGAALLIISVLGYRSYRNRQKLQQAKIDELETEKQLTATEAVLKGEEQERSRLAKDLHDGLGGMLSGVKYSLSNMKGNLIMTPENAQAFERSIDMLDSSINEMRRVAHNMMPEILVKYGLDAALKEFCDEIDRSGAIRTTYQSIGMTGVTIEQTIALTVYRVVQELVNNTIKHAAAQNLIVQLHAIESEKVLAITVEDDGLGFDAASLKHAAGIGWKNIQNRIDFLKGKFDIQSLPGKGSSIMIEINI